MQILIHLKHFYQELIFYYFMQASQSLFRSQQTQFLYHMLTLLQENPVLQQQQRKQEKQRLKAKVKRAQNIQVIPMKKLSFNQTKKWSIQSSQQKSPNNKFNIYHPLTTRANKTYEYFKSSNNTPKSKASHIIINQTFDQVNKSIQKPKKGTKNISAVKSKLFNKSKLDLIKKTIQFESIQKRKTKHLAYFNTKTSVIYKLLKERYWFQVTIQIEQANFVWGGEKEFIMFQKQRIDEIKSGKKLDQSYLVNHLPIDISKIFLKSNTETNLYIPFCLQVNNYKDISKVVDLAQSKQIKYWIIKPLKDANFSNSHICKTQFLKQFLINKYKSKKYQSNQIVQQYIHLPFLYNKRKFIIRTFLLVTNINKIIKAYLYNPLSIHISALQYQVDSTHYCVHFTGNKIQRQSKYYGKYQQNNRISEKEFNKYLQKYAQQNEYLNVDYRQGIRQSCLGVVHNITQKINNYYDHINYMQLFQASFIMQNNGSILLIGMKGNIDLKPKYKQKQEQRLLQNILKLSLDFLYPPPLSYLSRYEPSLQQFQLIADSRAEKQAQKPLIYIQ